MRRALLAAALVLVGCGQAVPTDRLGRAVSAMEALRGIRFSLDARSVASSDGTGTAGDLALDYHATGELVPPERMRLMLRDPVPATLVIIGSRAWRDGRPIQPTALRALAQPQAVLEQAREPGVVSLAGLGFARGNLTMRYRVDRGDRGTVEVELGLFDDLIRRQSFTVTEAAAPDGTGLVTVHTSYGVEYWDFGLPLDIGEPN